MLKKYLFLHFLIHFFIARNYEVMDPSKSLQFNCMDKTHKHKYSYIYMYTLSIHGEINIPRYSSEPLKSLSLMSYGNIYDIKLENIYFHFSKKYSHIP